MQWTHRIKRTTYAYSYDKIRKRYEKVDSSNKSFPEKKAILRELGHNEANYRRRVLPFALNDTRVNGSIKNDRVTSSATMHALRSAWRAPSTSGAYVAPGCGCAFISYIIAAWVGSWLTWLWIEGKFKATMECVYARDARHWFVLTDLRTNAPLILSSVHLHSAYV